MTVTTRAGALRRERWTGALRTLEFFASVSLAILLVTVSSMAVLPGCRNVLGQSRLTVPRGSALDVALQKGVSSRWSRSGDPIIGKIVRPLIVEGRTAIASGTIVLGALNDVRSWNELTGDRASMTLLFKEVQLPDGARYEIRSAPIHIEASGSNGTKVGEIDVSTSASRSATVALVEEPHGADGVTSTSVAGTGATAAGRNDQVDVYQREIELSGGQELIVRLEESAKIPTVF